jgi:hypothetical protein
MLSKEDWMEIKAQAEMGVYLKDIASSLSSSTRIPSLLPLFSNSGYGLCRRELGREQT